MAIGVIFDGVGVGQDQHYQLFNETADNGTQQIPGLLTHHGGPYPWVSAGCWG